MHNFELTLDQARQVLLDHKHIQNYNCEIYKNLTSADCPSQLVIEYALSLMFYRELKSLGWQCTCAPLNWDGDIHSVENPNEWFFVKDNHSILIIFGDGVTKNLDKNPDLVITDSCRFFDVGNIEKLSPEIFGLHQHVIESQYQDKDPSLLFNCFMAAPSTHRQCWLYELQRNNLLELGNVSYWLADRSETTLNGNNINKLKVFDTLAQSPLNSIFGKEHTVLREKIPYKNFDSTLEDAIIDTKVSVVIETEYDRPEQMFFTEKTFRAMLMPRPFMIFSSGAKTGAIDYLRSTGFDVYDDIIDHSYDQTSDPVPRMLAMIEQLKNLNTLVLDSTTRKKLSDRAQHNQSLVKQLRQNLAARYYQALEKIKQLS